MFELCEIKALIKKKRRNKTKTKRQILNSTDRFQGEASSHLMVHTPNACKILGWARKLGGGVEAGLKQGTLLWDTDSRYALLTHPWEKGSRILTQQVKSNCQASSHTSSHFSPHNVLQRQVQSTIPVQTQDGFDWSIAHC